MTRLPAPNTLLPLLADLANEWLAAHPGSKGFRLRSVRATPTALLLEFSLMAGASELPGLPRRVSLSLTPVETQLERSEFELGIGAGGKMAALVGLGARLIPRFLLNEVLKYYLGEGLRVEGNRIHAEHGPLIERLKALQQPSQD